MIQVKTSVTLGALLSAAVLLINTYQIHQSYQSKIQQQSEQNEKVKSFRGTYDQLKSVQKLWSTSFTKVDPDIDIYKLQKQLRLDSIKQITPDTLNVSEFIALPDAPLYRACLTNQSSGFELTSESALDALSYIDVIAKRRDLQFKDVTFSKSVSAKGTTYAVNFDAVCLLMQKT